MDSQNSKLKVLIVGASGALGSLVTRHCLTKPNLLVNVLVRDPQKNKEQTEAVEKAGGKVFKGDVTKPESYKGITKGMHTVIFTLPPFGSDVNVDSQLRLIDDCVANGVQRVVPANFTWNFSKFSKEEIDSLPLAYGKQKVQDHLKNLPIKTLVIDNGIFVESMFQLAVEKNFGYWGDPDQKIQMTTYEDAAKYTAAAVANENEEGLHAFGVHDLSVNELAAIYNKVRGTNFVPKRLGSIADRKAKGEELERQGQTEEAILPILFSYLTEKSRFDRIDNNLFPKVKTTSVEELLEQRPDIIL